ncbi:tellurium resistance protein TerA [Streptomyces uncialis]|uniref:tellurium resistance protein TerA n=1 Tax=Streptomyces uncialis TaxID=1048205 RepID=UPI0038698B32|nr:tellurium resistance protein TerA [Streptomyces uncialis]
MAEHDGQGTGDRPRGVIRLRPPDPSAPAPDPSAPAPDPSAPARGPAKPPPPTPTVTATPPPAPPPVRTPPAPPSVRTPAPARSRPDVTRPVIATRTRPRTPGPGARGVPEAAPPPPPVLSSASPQARITGRGILQANLNWASGVDADLDLGCLVAFPDGGGLAVQALGEAYGSLDEWPYVALDQDDRTGASADGETLRVNLAHTARFERLLFYVYVYEGAVDFRSLGATVTVTAPGEAGCRIPLDDSPAGAVACAVALVRPAVGGLSVRREARWFRPVDGLWIHQQLDQAYGFGFEWTYATKPSRG